MNILVEICDINLILIESVVAFFNTFCSDRKYMSIRYNFMKDIYTNFSSKKKYVLKEVSYIQ